jgi:hypothetical protein
MTCKKFHKYHKLKILHKEEKWTKVMAKGLIIMKLAVGSSNPNFALLSFFYIEDN